MQKKFTPSLCALLLLAFSITTTSAQGWRWAAEGSGNGKNSASAVAVDHAGHALTVGTIEQTANFGGINLVCSGIKNAFLARYNTDGTISWAKRFPSVMSQAYDVRADDQGNAYVCGTYQGSITIDTVALPINNGNEWGYLAKFDAAGNVVWATGPRGMSKCASIDVASNGDVYVTGSYTDSLIFASDTLLGSQSFQNVFLAKYNAAGIFQWATSGTTYNNFSGGSNVRVGPNDEVYLEGRCQSNLYLSGLLINAFQGNFNIFLARYDSNGTIQWGNYVDVTSSDDNVSLAVNTAGEPTLGWFYGFQFKFRGYGPNGALLHSNNYNGSFYSYSNKGMCSDNLGNLIVTGWYFGNLTLGNTTLHAANFNDLFVFQITPAGQINWALDVNGAEEVRGHGVAADPDGNVYVAGEFWGVTYFENIRLNGGFWWDAFTAKILSNPNKIRGVAYRDLNYNNIRDGAEPPFPGVIVEVQPGNLYVTTDTSGQFVANTDSGSYNLSVPVPPIYHSVTPNQQDAQFAGYGGMDSLNDFALQAPAGIHDLRVNLTTMSNFQPGFVGCYGITYSNVGTETLSGSVSFVADDTLQLDTLYQQPDQIFGDSFVWSFNNLAPGESGSLTLCFEIPQNMMLGDPVSGIAWVYPVAGDMAPQDNVDTLNHVLFASYDPNDKQVEPAGILSPTQIANGDWLTYTIRFQNTGNAPASIVRIIDTLSHFLYVPSFEMLSASHAYTYAIRGQGVVEWTFNPIVLPDSTANEPASHGFVRFRIRPLPNVQVGESIQNRAQIYFDFNPPINTNWVQSPVELVNSLLETSTESGLGYKVFPNPASGTFYLAAPSENTTSASMELFDLNGRKWLEINNIDNQRQPIRTNGLPSGMYLLRIQTAEGMQVERVVIMNE